MKEELILFETAKLAKKKGFDINTTSNCWVKTLDGDIIHNSERKNITEHDRCKQYLMQPSQSLLQKWLREKHGIEVQVYRSMEMPSGCKYGCEVESWIKEESEDLGNFYAKTYEEALEVGLQEGLKSISFK